MVDPWEGWTAGAFDALGVAEDGGWTPYRAAGWIKGAFALDFRPMLPHVWDATPNGTPPFVWVLTHLPTQYGMCAMAAPAETAVVLADQIAAMTDWSAVTVGSAPFLNGRMQAFMAQHRRIFVCNGNQTIPPWGDVA